LLFSIILYIIYNYIQYFQVKISAILFRMSPVWPRWLNIYQRYDFYKTSWDVRALSDMRVNWPLRKM